jgi:ferredoxin
MPVMHSLYREAGEVHVDAEVCKHCGICARTCPGEVLVMDEGIPRAREDSPFGCIACGHCMMSCPEEAITVTVRRRRKSRV